MGVNLSTAYVLNMTMSSLQNQEIHVKDLVDNYCTQIDTKIIIGLIWILYFYVFSKIIAPMSEKGLNALMPQFIGVWGKFIDMFISFSETFALMSIFAILGVAWYQFQFLRTHYVMLYILGGLLVGAMIIKFFEWKDGGKRNVIKEDIIEFKDGIEKIIKKKD